MGIHHSDKDSKHLKDDWMRKISFLWGIRGQASVCFTSPRKEHNARNEKSNKEKEKKASVIRYLEIPREGWKPLVPWTNGVVGRALSPGRFWVPQLLWVTPAGQKQRMNSGRYQRVKIPPSAVLSSHDEPANLYLTQTVACSLTAPAGVSCCCYYSIFSVLSWSFFALTVLLTFGPPYQLQQCPLADRRNREKGGFSQLCWDYISFAEPGSSLCPCWGSMTFF